MFFSLLFFIRDVKDPKNATCKLKRVSRETAIFFRAKKKI